jgi:ADP-heptose:LPS heptosyltransferase
VSILVIRLGALGDLVQAFDAFHAIRRHHPRDEIVLLTAPEFARFARAMPWFDQVWEDGRGRSVLHYLAVGWRLRRGGFTRVYDLQNKPRTRRYRLLSGLRRRWPLASNTGPAAKGSPEGPVQQNHDRYLAQLAAAGVEEADGGDHGTYEPADLTWLDEDVRALQPDGRYLLLIPGCSPHLPHKRWPAGRYAELARRLLERRIMPVLIGTDADAEAALQIRIGAPGTASLIGRTSLAQVAALARGALATVGNDTGPVFLAASVGCPTLMLMSHHTDPERSAPWGPRATWMKRPDLAGLATDEVDATLSDLLGL